IENDAVVGEPPIHVHRAAGALQRVLKTRQRDVGGSEGFGLARTRLADHEVPRQYVWTFPGGRELVEAFLKLAAQVIELGPAVSACDALRRRAKLRAQITAENFCLRFLLDRAELSPRDYQQ